jgi:lysophospholipase L1-like esterase
MGARVTRLGAATLALFVVTSAAPAAQSGGRVPPPVTFEGDGDHRNMMEQLGIRALRPGANGNDPATYDEATANRWPLPELLRMKNGRPVTSAKQWRARRAEIAEDFEREVYGRIPKTVPKVTWTVAETHTGALGDVPTVTKTLVGHVDNSACPSISVDIRAKLTTPADAASPVPVMIDFTWVWAKPPAVPPPPPAWQGLLVSKGWGFVLYEPVSVQADNASLTSGIIGLTNLGQPRKPDDWGALRAWAWGASRVLDYLETDRAVDARHVGVEGLSRYGKAALVAQAFDPRVAIGFIGSSGEGGAKPHRRDFGERVENLTGSGEYHWMAGNFLKYGASDAVFGAKTAGDLPVDAHELIALCAPRPCFISYGVPEKGDAKWVDARGSFMATVAAGPAYRLLGKRDLGTPGNYLTVPMPPVNTLIGGELAWRQHDGGHSVAESWPAFLQWASQFVAAPARRDGAVAIERTDPSSKTAHAELVEKTRRGRIDVYFVGDSITRRWGTSDEQYAAFLASWRRNFTGWNAADFGWGGDTVANVLWRMTHGELDGVSPKVVVLMAGTNDVGKEPPSGSDDPRVARVVSGIEALLRVFRQKTPKAVVVLMGITPRADNPAVMPLIDAINSKLATLADGKTVRYVNINRALTDEAGRLRDGMLVSDGLHFDVGGYQVWANAIRPILMEVLGPPAAEDHAPPPTGDPSTRARQPGGASS